MFNNARVALLILIMGVAPFANADDHDHRRAHKLQAAGKILPLEKIVERAEATYPKSKVLEIEFKDKLDKYTYEIEIVDQSGVVHELYFNAANGELLRTNDDKD